MAAEVPGKVESKAKRRVDTTRNTVSREVNIAKTAVRDLLNLKPVQSIVGLLTDTVDNLGDGIKEQARITREWAG
jgi:hypothetical protein